MIWIVPLAVTGGAVLLASLLRWIHGRRRIARLDWPERFEDWKKLRDHARLYLKKKGWSVQGLVLQGTEMRIKKSDREAGVQFLIAKEHSKTVPYHFLNRLVAAADSQKRPVVLITDFTLPDEVIAQSNSRSVYPVCCRDLARLEELVPTRNQLRKLAAKAAPRKAAPPQISA